MERRGYAVPLLPCPPEAVVFDNDGLLLDTEPCWTLAEEALFSRYSARFDLTAKRALVGTSPVTAAPILERLLPGTEPGAELSRQLYALAVDEIAAGATPRPGAVDLVRELQAAGTPLAVASNSPRLHLLAGLHRTGLFPAFGVVLGVDDVANPKPAPDLYLAACAGLNAAPESAIALEDSPPGVAAARAAGMWVIGIPSVPGVTLQADMTADTLADSAVSKVLLGAGSD
jgi:HAD superfamily hydrolase (TIGR01509 family)